MHNLGRGESALMSRCLPPHKELIHECWFLNKLSESWSGLDFLLMAYDEVHANIFQASCAMVLCCHHDLHYVVNGYGLPDDVLTKRLKTIDEEAFGSNEQVYGKLGCDVSHLVGVYVFKQLHEDCMGNIGQHYSFICSRLSHATVEECTEVLGPCCQVSSSGIHRLALDEESDIGKCWIVNELPQIIDEVAGRYRDRLKSKLVEVIQDNAPVVATKDIQRISEYLRHKGGSPTRWILCAQ